MISRMVFKVATFIGFVIAALLVYAATKSPEMSVFREARIQASPEAIFPYINNSKKMNIWMPWKDEDPEVVMNYSGTEEGLGSVSSWDSSGKMGTGSSEVVESIPNESVKTKLIYTKPMAMSQMAEISLIKQGNETIVRWSVRWQANYISRIVCIFMDMDRIIGKSFERGLENLKKQVEG